MPEVQQVHTDAALTNVSVKYGGNEFVGGAIAPTVGVQKKSDVYYIIDPYEDAKRQQDTNRAPGTRPSEVNWAVTTGSYACSDHALAHYIPDEERENADAVLGPDIQATEMLTQQIMLDKEIKLVAALDAGVTATAAATEYWGSGDANPLNDVITGIKSVRGTIHKVPNVLIFDYDVLLALQVDPYIIDRLKYGQTAPSPAVVTVQSLAQLFMIDRVLIASCSKNSAGKNQDASISSVWGKGAYLAYVPPRPALREPSVAYTLAWTAMNGGMNGYQVRTGRDDKAKSDWMDVSYYYDQKVVTDGAGYRITACIA